MSRRLSRQENKLITRNRLLEAAVELLQRGGHAALSTSAVARGAGVAQPTFYVHFRDKDDLLRALADEKIGALRTQLRETRAPLGLDSGADAIRESYALPLRALCEHGELFKLSARAYMHPSASPLGEQARRLRRELEADLVEDYERMGVPCSTPEERQRLTMIADAMIAQTEALALGFLEGRYQSIDAIADLLSEMSVGMVLALRR